MSDEITNFDLPVDAYATFDAESLKSLIIQRLTKQNIFTDQVYEGSNMSSIIDIIAYSYHTLLYYLNQTSSQAMFTESTIYENITRIVKLLNYKPIGYQASTLTFKCNASNVLVPGTYTIPRYTYINSGGVTYSTVQDISFTKTLSSTETISTVGDNNLMYQGEWVEYPEETAAGEEFETIVVTPPLAVMVDHFNLHIYVRDRDTGGYTEYTETSSLFTHGPTDDVFEKTYNEKEYYEIKFGNGVTGSRLKPGDGICIYYMAIGGPGAMVASGFLDGEPLALYGTNKWNAIKTSIKSENIEYLNFDSIDTLGFTNTDDSTMPMSRETVSDIKEKAPLYFTSQNRLVTSNDFETFVKRNYGNIVNSVKVVDNDTYIDTHLRYLHDTIGITNPNLESRVLYNQAHISTSTNFNNVYIYGVPKINLSTSVSKIPNFLGPAQKESIVDEIEKVKMLSIEPVIIDPIYMAVDIGYIASGESEIIDVTDNTQLHIKRDRQAIKNKSSLIEQVYGVIASYFDTNTLSLGQLIATDEILTKIVSIDGIESIYTYRTDTKKSVYGMSLVVWNPVHPELDITITNQNVQLPTFKFPYLYDSTSLKDKIIVVD